MQKHRPLVNASAISPATSVAAIAAILCLGGCGGGGAITSTPTPIATPTPTPTPAPISPISPVATNFDTAEYRRSNGAAAAQAIVAYQAGATGAGVTVAVIDSGVASSNVEFAGRISPLSRDVAGDRGFADEDGHGTEVSGIILAARNGAGIHGVAFEATLLALRADRVGSCAETNGCAFGSNALAAAFDVAAQARARAINLSLGGDGTSPFTLRLAAGRAVAAGGVIVMAAGNDGSPESNETATSLQQAVPGAVIIAGAIDDTRTIASFSNRAGAAAPYYLTALGVRVRSFDQTGTAFLYSGTSEATPIISGAVALLAQAFPTLSPVQIVDILLRTADDLGDTGTDAIYGRGALNIARAFAPIGALTVEKVADPLAATATGVLAGPLGDATQFGSAISKLPVTDIYGRSYRVDLGGQLRRQGAGRLANALLAGNIANAAGRYGAADIAVSVRDSSSYWRGDVATGVDWRDRPRGAFLGGQALLAVAPGQSLVLGYGQSPAAMLDTAAGGPDAVAPLVATRAGESGMVAQSLGGAAFARRSGAWTIGTAFGTQSQAFGDRSEPATASRALLRADRRIGAMRVGVGAELLVEQGTLLGSQLPPVFGISGASTTSALIRVELPFGDWSLLGDARIGTTRGAVSGTGLVQGRAQLTSTAASLALTRAAVIADDDRISLTLAQPLRATGMIDLVTETSAVRLGPSGRETAIELDYLRALDTGSVSFAAFWRDQPGNIAGSAVDVGIAARLRLGF